MGTIGDDEHIASTTVNTPLERVAQATPLTLSIPQPNDGTPAEDVRCSQTELGPAPSLPKKEVSISSMLTDVPALGRELSGLSSVSVSGHLQSSLLGTRSADLSRPAASGALKVVRDISSGRRRRVAMASMVGGAAILGTGGGAAGLLTGSVIGVVVGMVPGVFTFGLSIPLFAAIGGGCGLATGTVVGGTIGLVGVAAGRRVLAHREEWEQRPMAGVTIRCKDTRHLA